MQPESTIAVTHCDPTEGRFSKHPVWRTARRCLVKWTTQLDFSLASPMHFINAAFVVSAANTSAR